MFKVCLLFAVLLLTFTGCPRGPGGPSNVVGGIPEPDYKYPWVVKSGTFACHGVLIHPQWVLTAAHCVTPTAPTSFGFRRTDPYTGQFTDFAFHQSSQIIQHPMFNKPTALDNDIALVKLAEPFAITPFIQTAGIPATPRNAGTIGTVASVNDSTLAQDRLAVFRAAIPVQDPGPAFDIPTTDATGSLCPGDSGSGFVTLENGRAIVRGIASARSMTGGCTTAAGHRVFFADVFEYRDWIFQTMRETDYRVAGNTRVRWKGRAARGSMLLGCVNPFGTMAGPLNVAGVEEGANCEPGQTQSVVCSLSDVQTGPLTMVITGFTMRTECPPHGATVQSLPFSPSWASFFGPMPTSPDPVGICFREFTCQIGLGEAYEPGNDGTLSK